MSARLFLSSHQQLVSKVLPTSERQPEVPKDEKTCLFVRVIRFAMKKHQPKVFFLEPLAF